MFFYYFLLFILSISLIYSTGHIALSCFSCESSKRYFFPFFKLFTGLLVVVFMYSFLKTGGKTINSGFVLIAILFYINSPHKIDLLKYRERLKIKKNDIITLLSILLFSSFIFIWKYYCLFNEGQEFPIVINADSIFHSNIAIFLNSSGIESLNTNYYYPPNGTHPYHYFESWSIAFFSFLLHLNYWVTEELIVYPIYALLIITGIWALIEKFTPLTIINKIFSVSVLFFSSYFFEHLIEISSLFNLKETYSFNFNALDEYWCLKLAVAYIFSIACLLLLIDKKTILAIIILLGLPLATISLAPGILGACSIFLFCCFLLYKKTAYKKTFISVFMPVVIFCFITLFYLITGSTTEYITTPSPDILLNELTSFVSIKSKVVLFIYRILQLIIFYSPVWIIFMLSFFTSKGIWSKHFEKLKGTLVFTIILILFSLVVWLLLQYSFGSKAYFFYASLPFINILSVLFLIFSKDFTQSSIVKWSIFIFIFFTMTLFSLRSYSSYKENKTILWNRYSSKFIKEVYDLSKNIKNTKGGRMEGKKYFNNPVFIDNVDHFGPFLSGFNKTNNGSFILTSLSSIEIDSKQLNNTLNKNYVLKSPLYLFKNNQIERAQYKNNETTRIEFIKKYKFEYLIVNKDVVLDNSIKSIIKKQLKDSKSGISFVLLDLRKLNQNQIIH